MHHSFCTIWTRCRLARSLLQPTDATDQGALGQGGRLSRVLPVGEVPEASKSMLHSCKARPCRTAPAVHFGLAQFPELPMLYSERGG